MIKEELVYHIRLSLLNGKTLKEIKDELTEKGHDKKEIKKAIDDVKKDKKLYKLKIEPQEKIEKHKKLVIEVISGIFILAILGIALFIMMAPPITDNEDIVIEIIQTDYCSEVELINLISEGKSKTCYIDDSNLQLMFMNKGEIKIEKGDLWVTGTKDSLYMIINKSIDAGEVSVKIIKYNRTVYGDIETLSLVPTVDGKLCSENPLEILEIKEC